MNIRKLSNQETLDLLPYWATAHLDLFHSIQIPGNHEKEDPVILFAATKESKKTLHIGYVSKYRGDRISGVDWEFDWQFGDKDGTCGPNPFTGQASRAFAKEFGLSTESLYQIIFDHAPEAWRKSPSV